MRKSAIISECGLYRYELRREWDERLPPYVSGMLNPSTADAEIDDPTIVRNLRRARTLGCGSLIVWNLGAGRATHPRDWMGMSDPIGPDNYSHTRRILSECRSRNGLAVVGWGNYGARVSRFTEAVHYIAADLGLTLMCLGITKAGHPRHPLYVPYATDLAKWDS